MDQEQKSHLIYRQIVSAILDKCEDYATVYYEPATGATTAAVAIAREFGAALITMSYESRRYLERATKMKWYTIGNLNPLVITNRILIADSLRDHQIDYLKELARDRSCKIISTKRIQVPEEFKIQENNLSLRK